MNLLMLTPRFPYPPNRGDTLRSWHEAAYLAARHNLWLASLNEHPPPESDVARMRKICAGVAVFPRAPWLALAGGLCSLARGKSLTQGYFHRDALVRTIRQWSRAVRFDAVLTFTTALAHVAEKIETRRVLDMCDVDSAKWELYADRAPEPLRRLYRLEANRLRRAEQRAVRTHAVTLVVNRRERDKLLAVSDPRGSDVVHTCVEPPHSAGDLKLNADTPREPIVGCVGSMFYPPNVRGVNWFGRHVWPRIKSRFPQAQWWIVGQRPTRAVRLWGRLPGVLVTGTVADVAPLLAKMRVFVCPVRGDLGVQSKVLGALAAGKACVVTPDAAAGIDFDEPPFLIAREASEFAECVGRLLEDDRAVRELNLLGRRTIETRYAPDTQLWRVESALTGVETVVDCVHQPASVTQERNESVIRALAHATSVEIGARP